MNLLVGYWRDFPLSIWNLDVKIAREVTDRIQQTFSRCSREALTGQGTVAVRA